ncbi:MAG: zinc transporter ZupT [Bacilli bacterium]|nr:zinc transporter ZupT [Bacilli bacterium]
MNSIWVAFILTLFAGLSTSIGAFISLFSRRDNKQFLAAALGFSAGVMVYVSLVDLFQQGISDMTSTFSPKIATIYGVIAFFSGILLIAIIDRVIPASDNPHEIQHNENNIANKRLFKVGILTAIAIAIHNFPEGIATFISGLQDLSLALPITFAIALHNIPEGIAVATPIYYATGNKKRAFLLSSISGLAEVLGGLIGYLILRPFINDVVLGMVLCAVAGIMVFISIDELIPTAKEYDKGHISIYGFVLGMLIMAISIITFM